MAVMIYLFLVPLAGGLIGPIKSNPHLWNTSVGIIGCSGCEDLDTFGLTHWHMSHCLQYIYTSLFIVGHQ